MIETMRIRESALAWLAVSAAVVLAGCSNTPQKAAEESGRGHYMTLPSETGSRLPRRVWVNEDGVISDPASAVQTASPDALSNMQRKGNVNLKSGN